MADNSALTRRNVLALAGTSVLGMGATSALEEGDNCADSQPATILGTWNATERHKSHGSLFQPIHEARKRDAVLYFDQEGEKLTGRTLTPNYKQIVSQGDWNGQTPLERVQFVNNKLVFEVRIVEWDPMLSPLSAELKRKDHKGTIRVEAKLKGDKLVGKWGVFTRGGAEIFRGEWEAVRAESQEKK